MQLQCLKKGADYQMIHFTDSFSFLASIMSARVYTV